MRRNAGSSFCITGRPKMRDWWLVSSVVCGLQDVVSSWKGREGWVWVWLEGLVVSKTLPPTNVGGVASYCKYHVVNILARRVKLRVVVVELLYLKNNYCCRPWRTAHPWSLLGFHFFSTDCIFTEARAWGPPLRCCCRNAFCNPKRVTVAKINNNAYLQNL